MFINKIKIKPLLLSVLPAVIPLNQSQAANHTFQDFFFTACVNATGSLATRCDETTDNGKDRGDLSGDSELSLNPTQSLSYNINAVAETSTRIKAMIEKIKNKGNEELFFNNKSSTDREAMEVFRMSGSSLLLQIDSGKYRQDKTQEERGFDKKSTGIKLGLDYRISDSWLAGMMLGYDRFQQTFEQGNEGRNFTPQANEGESDAKNYSFSLFTSKNLNENIYLEGMASYISSKYKFDRNAVFQVANRTIELNRDVNARANTNGRQLALNLGAGYSYNIAAMDLTLYSRLDYQKSTIDGYSESGTTGLEMRVSENRFSETVGTLGLKLSGNINMSYGILIPQIYVEWLHAFNRDRANSNSYYIEDGNKLNYSTIGNVVDYNSGNIGFSLLTGLPNGWMGYIGANKEIDRDYVSQYRINAGLRVEF